MNEIYLILKIQNFNSKAKWITKQLGIKPTSIWEKGHIRKIRNSKVKILVDSWELESDLDVHRSLSDHMENIFNKINNLEAFRQITREFDVILFCAIYFCTSNPSFRIDTKLLKFLGDYNIKLDFDLYFIKSCRASD